MRILLADDSITIQKVVNLTFADEGVEVVSVSNGDMAERKLAEVKPDLVLADVFMPGRNGYELCQYIKESPQFAHIPVVLLVGAFEPFDEAEAARVRADAHLTKPFESRALIETVFNLVGTRSPRATEEEPIGTLLGPAQSPETHTAQGWLQREAEGDRSDFASEPEGFDFAAVPLEAAAEVGFDLASGISEQQAPLEAATEVGFDLASGISEQQAPLEAATEVSFDLASGISEQQVPLEAATEVSFDLASGISEQQVPLEAATEVGFDLASGISEQQVPLEAATEVGFDLASGISEQQAEGEFGPGAEAGLREVREMEGAAMVEQGAGQASQDQAQVFLASDMWTGGDARFTPAEADGYPSALIDEIVRRVVARMTDEVVREVAWEVVPDCVERIIENLTRELLSKRG